MNEGVQAPCSAMLTALKVLVKFACSPSSRLDTTLLNLLNASQALSCVVEPSVARLAYKQAARGRLWQVYKVVDNITREDFCTCRACAFLVEYRLPSKSLQGAVG